MITEKRNIDTMNLDCMTIEEILETFNNEDEKVAYAVRKVISEIKQAVEIIVPKLSNGGRLFYIGAGTSGRLGILDAVECVPTFGICSTMVQGIIAGGENAMYAAIEGAEDDEEAGEKDLSERKLCSKDVVVAIAASGKTPYCVGALKYANNVGAETISISCNKNSLLGQHSKCSIEVDCGPEVITGSTRLKAGTAQKMILNMISSSTMIKMGKVYENLMVDVRPTNKKLTDRAIRIIMEATNCDRVDAENTFIESEKNVKVAIIMILGALDKNKAEQILMNNNGFIRKVEEEWNI